MATIKDIAKLAGVAQGTVSNVLNGRGNVSSEKIKAVYDAAQQLGYVHNERAALLRKGHINTLAIIAPDSRTRQYENFYVSFKEYANLHGYKVIRQFTNENSIESEAEAINEVNAQNINGIACISVAAGTYYEQYLYNNLAVAPLVRNMLFVDRKPLYFSNFLGFDYRLAGKEMAYKVLSNNYNNICLLTGDLKFTTEKDFYDSFMAALNRTNIHVTHIVTDSYRKYQNIMQILDQPLPQAFFISNYDYAESVKDICRTFYDTDALPEIYTVSSIFTMPENDFHKFEMNYNQLGKTAARLLIEKANNPGTASKPIKEFIRSDGFKNWYSHISIPQTSSQLNVLTLDSPEAYIMKSFSRLFTKKTGIEINISILSYDEIYETFNALDSFSYFDVLRLDVTWLSWFAEKLLIPLTDIDPDIENLFSGYIDGIPEHFTKVNGVIYTLPSTPSTQMLFYRKDLFEDSVQKRLFWEKYKKELTPPDSFADFNRIASFFTKSVNPESPVDYGTTITMGSTGVAGSEYLARLFSYQDHLYNKYGEIHLDSDISVKALCDMIEIKKYTSRNYCYWWTDTAEHFSEGNYAMALLFSNYTRSLLNPSSKIVGKIGYSLMPGKNPLIGGGSLGVSKNTKRPEAALSFIKWMCNEPISSATTFLGSTSPCKNTYDNYDVMHNYPWLNLSKECFKLAKGNRLPKGIETPFDERKFLSIIGAAARNAYSNVTTPAEALRCAQMQFEKYFTAKF